MVTWITLYWEHLVIPRMGTLCEDLVRLAHDSLGHFGFKKSYTTLHGSYVLAKYVHRSSQLIHPFLRRLSTNKGSTSKPVRTLTSLADPQAMW